MKTSAKTYVLLLLVLFLCAYCKNREYVPLEQYQGSAVTRTCDSDTTLIFTGGNGDVNLTYLIDNNGGCNVDVEATYTNQNKRRDITGRLPRIAERTKVIGVLPSPGPNAADTLKLKFKCLSVNGVGANCSFQVTASACKEVNGQVPEDKQNFTFNPGAITINSKCEPTSASAPVITLQNNSKLIQRVSAQASNTCQCGDFRVVFMAGVELVCPANGGAVNKFAGNKGYFDLQAGQQVNIQVHCTTPPNGQRVNCSGQIDYIKMKPK